MSWFEGKAYADSKGNYYHVVPVESCGKYATVLYIPDKAGYEFVPGLPFRKTAAEAQRDLDARAKREGWAEK